MFKFISQRTKQQKNEGKKLKCFPEYQIELCRFCNKAIIFNILLYFPWIRSLFVVSCVRKTMLKKLFSSFKDAKQRRLNLYSNKIIINCYTINIFKSLSATYSFSDSSQIHTEMDYLFFTFIMEVLRFKIDFLTYYDLKKTLSTLHR